jgi:hypothetical protein
VNLKRKTSNRNVKLGIIIIATQPEYIIMNGAHWGCPCTHVFYPSTSCLTPSIAFCMWFSYAPKCVMWFVWLLYAIRDLRANSECMLKFYLDEPKKNTDFLNKI